jgi:hypothetical protein
LAWEMSQFVRSILRSGLCGVIDVPIFEKLEFA